MLEKLLSRNKSHTIAESLTSKRQRDYPTVSRMGNPSGVGPVEASAESFIASEFSRRKLTNSPD